MANVPSIISRGFELLASGQAREALVEFNSAPPSPAEQSARQIGIALCGRELGLHSVRAEAIKRLLALEPGNLWGNLLQGELLADAEDPVAALSFYMNALRIADQHASLPSQLSAEVTKARDYCHRFSEQLDERIRREVTATTPRAADTDLSLFHQSLDILFGRKQIYSQSPRYYYYPGLPQRQFFPEAMFDWIPALETRTANIRNEALGMLATAHSFKPYLKSDPSRPHKQQDGMTDNSDWSACHLIHNGEVVSEVADRCPETMAALRELPLCTLPRRSPSVLFSLLKPGAHIPPHSGLINTRLICHLPVVCPPGCQFRVGNDTREWQEGKVWVFDDSIEHEAWNRSDQTRIILLFEIWRPELSIAERNAITELFKALDGSGQGTPSWEI